MILGNEIEARVFKGIVPVLLVGLTVSFLIHWWADQVFLVNWFRKAEVTTAAFFGVGSVNNTRDPLTALKERLDGLGSALDQADQSATAKVDGRVVSFDEVAQNVSILKEMLVEVRDAQQGIERRFEIVKGTGFLLVYVWYFSVPILLVFLSTISLSVGLAK